MGAGTVQARETVFGVGQPEPSLDHMQGLVTCHRQLGERPEVDHAAIAVGGPHRLHEGERHTAKRYEKTTSPQQQESDEGLAAAAARLGGLVFSQRWGWGRFFERSWRGGVEWLIHE